MDSLTEQDLHCIARIFQSVIFDNGATFTKCKYCKYYKQCIQAFPNIHFDNVREKLGAITGIHLGICVPTKKELENEN